MIKCSVFISQRNDLKTFLDMVTRDIFLKYILWLLHQAACMHYVSQTNLGMCFGVRCDSILVKTFGVIMFSCKCLQPWSLVLSYNEMQGDRDWFRDKFHVSSPRKINLCNQRKWTLTSKIRQKFCNKSTGIWFISEIVVIIVFVNSAILKTVCNHEVTADSKVDMRKFISKFILQIVLILLISPTRSIVTLQRRLFYLGLSHSCSRGRRNERGQGVVGTPTSTFS